MSTCNWRACGMSAVILGLASGGAHSAGFLLQEQNASGLGNAYAGSAAIAQDASTIFFNPAGMARLPGVNASIGVTAIQPSFKFSDTGSTPPPLLGARLGSDNGGDAGSLGAVPNAYLSWQLNPDWYAGLGLNAPFGLKTEYDDSWVGRYQSYRFSLITANVNPAVAYKINDQLSVGVGVNWMYLDADYRRAAPVPALTPFGLASLGEVDAKAKLKGDGWGWNAGLLYQMTPDTRLGLAYRSRVRIHADGDTTLSNRSVPAAYAGLIPGSADANTTVELPDSATLSLAHQLNSRWQLLADLSWTGWSSIRSLDIENSGAIPDDNLDLRFRDTWRLALGANYRHSEQWTFRGGVAWDQTPVRSAQYRPTSLPDSDRYWVSIGARYNVSPRTAVDVGYAHLFIKSVSIDNDTAAATKGVVRGDYSSNANILGVQFSHQF